MGIAIATSTASCLPFIRGGGPPKAVVGSMPRTTSGRWVFASSRWYCGIDPPVSFADRKNNVRYRALDLTEVSPGHFDPLGKGGLWVGAKTKQERTPASRGCAQFGYSQGVSTLVASPMPSQVMAATVRPPMSVYSSKFSGSLTSPSKVIA